MFWYRWNSWVVELLGGLLLATLAQPLHRLGWQAVATTTASVGYEYRLDPNGWSWRDVGQRQVGIGIGLAVWKVIR